MHLISSDHQHSSALPSSSSSSSYSPSAYMPTPSGIQGQLLEVTVVGCTNLKDTEWISRQDPFVCLEYANTKQTTRTCTDGHKNPCFQEKFYFTLIEGLPELIVNVWNSNTITKHDLIGSGRIPLQKVLSQGYDDGPWTLQNEKGRSAGEIKLILHYANANSGRTGDKPKPGPAPTAPPYVAPAAYNPPPCVTPPPSAPACQPIASYPPVSFLSYPPPLSAPAYQPIASFPSYPPPPANFAVYPPSPYYPQPPVNFTVCSPSPPPPQLSAYTPQPYTLGAYPPYGYPPMQQASPYYPTGNLGTYPY